MKDSSSLEKYLKFHQVCRTNKTVKTQLATYKKRKMCSYSMVSHRTVTNLITITKLKENPPPILSEHTVIKIHRDNPERTSKVS
jgi:hypothetical protein